MIAESGPTIALKHSSNAKDAMAAIAGGTESLSGVQALNWEPTFAAG